MPNKHFPAGIDPLSDLLQLKTDQVQHTEAIIQLQENQNELIRATNDLLRQQSETNERIRQMMIYITNNYEKIKKQ